MHYHHCTKSQVENTTQNDIQYDIQHGTKDKITGFVMKALLLIGLSFNTAWGQQIETITQSNWPQYVNGANILALPQISNILRHFEETPQAVITITHPATEPGRQWGLAIGNWLVSFGIPSQHFLVSSAPDLVGQLIIHLDQTEAVQGS